MQLFIDQMNEEASNDILTWQYDRPYDFYNNERTDEALQEILDGSYYRMNDENNVLIGFFCIGANAKVPAGNEFGVYNEDLVDMGVGMNPTYVGKGNGFEFCMHVIRFIQEHYPNKAIRLTVATFNERAIHLYEKLGFVSEEKFQTLFAQFQTMIRREHQ